MPSFVAMEVKRNLCKPVNDRKCNLILLGSSYTLHTHDCVYPFPLSIDVFERKSCLKHIKTAWLLSSLVLVN